MWDPSTLLPTLVLVLIAVIGRAAHGSWLAPGAFFALFWASAVVAALAFAPDFTVEGVGLWWMVGAVAVVLAGSISGSHLTAIPGLRPTGLMVRDFPRLRLLLALATLAGLGAVTVVLQARGYSLTVFLSPSQLEQIQREYSVARYLEGFEVPTWASALLSATYFAALLGGLLLASAHSWRWKCMALAPIVAGTAMAAVETTKASIYYPIVLTVASFLAARVMLGSGPLLTRPRMLAAAGVVAIFAPISVQLQLSRYGFTAADPYSLSLVGARLHVALFGYLAVFTTWFTNQPQTVEWGINSFAGVFDVLGLHSRVIGIYTDQTYIGTAGGASNVYTMFRGLIQDFGPVGSLFALSIVGVIAGISFSQLKLGHKWALPIISMFYAVTIWSPVINLLVYNSMILAWVLLAGYLWLFARPAWRPQQMDRPHLGTHVPIAVVDMGTDVVKLRS